MTAVGTEPTPGPGCRPPRLAEQERLAALCANVEACEEVVSQIDADGFDNI